jgi:hypothetical protein
LTRRFVFRDVLKNPQKFAETAKSLDWSEVEIESLSEVDDDDIEAVRDWLKRLGMVDALKALDAKTK